MKLVKLSLVAAVIASSLAAEAVSDLGVSANVAMTSNYVWRGMTQTTDNMAIQGGFDLDYKGTYIGTWASNVDFAEGVELDIYAGYAGEFSGVSYDVGFIQYAYPNAVDANNFGEVYAGIGYDFEVAALSAKYSLGIETNDMPVEDYVEVGVDAPLPAEFTLSAHYGLFSNVGSDYSVGVSTSLDKIDFDLSYVAFVADSATGADDQDNIVFTVSSSF